MSKNWRGNYNILECLPNGVQRKGFADLGEFNNKFTTANMINSIIELPKMIADFPAPVLANPLLPALPLSETYMMDCIAGMKEYPDKWFDLAVVDPPYGIDLANMNMGVGKSKKASKIQNRKWVAKDWDLSVPQMEYFIELFRVSKNQIIWGGNYFDLPPCKNYIIWDKEIPNGLSFADCEMAWTSFNNAPKMFRYSAYLDKQSKFHPTQKPVKLYDWIFSKYGKDVSKVLDTHLGSGSSRIAAHKNNLNFVGFEIDKEYFDKQEKRFANYVCQPRLF